MWQTCKMILEKRKGRESKPRKEEVVGDEGGGGQRDFWH